MEKSFWMERRSMGRAPLESTDGRLKIADIINSLYEHQRKWSAMLPIHQRQYEFNSSQRCVGNKAPHVQSTPYMDDPPSATLQTWWIEYAIPTHFLTPSAVLVRNVKKCFNGKMN
jgi:hypothetical protein